MKNFKDLFVWKKAHSLVLLIYRLTSCFPKFEQYGLTGQLRRSATSIPTNIAEGCGRNSQADFARFLQISFGSSQEVEYLSLLSFDLGYIESNQYKDLNHQVNEVKAMLISLLAKVRNESHGIH
jgi:four helix bundle protein